MPKAFFHSLSISWAHIFQKLGGFSVEENLKRHLATSTLQSSSP
jgi:hypothetical protein